MGDIVKFDKDLGNVPKTLSSFASYNDRAMLTKVALKAFMNLCTKWNVTSDVALELSGLDEDEWRMSADSRYELVLNQDQLTRISALIGIFKGLNLLFADNFANDWPQKPNTGPLFDGETPINVMRDGGIPMMLRVRAHIDALRGGL